MRSLITRILIKKAQDHYGRATVAISEYPVGTLGHEGGKFHKAWADFLMALVEAIA